MSETKARATSSVDRLIVHGLVVTMNSDQEIIEDGAVAISGSQIIAVGPTSELEAKFDASESIDASDHIVMPGLINSHSHGPAVLFRGLVEDLNLYAWLDEMWKAEKKFITSATIRAAARLGFLEMIQSGITTALDMYWFPETSTQVAKEVGFRLMTGPVYMDTEAPPDGLPISQRTARGREYLQEYQNDPLIVTCVPPHSTYTVPPVYLQEARALADEFGVIFHTHASEDVREVADIQKRYGNTPIYHLDKLGLLDERTVLAHTVELSDDEVQLLAERRSVSVHNPVTNLKLGSGIARVPDMQNAGIPVLLGTDGPQSSNDFNLWLAMRLTAILHKGVQKDPTIMPTSDILQMVTSRAAKALGLGDRIGSLEADKRADIILINLSRPHLIPLHNVCAQLIYAVGREDVATVIINGRVVMRDRKMMTLDEEETMVAVSEIGRQITQSARA